MPTVFRFREYGGPDTQEFAELDRPRPGDGQLLVEVRAAGVNPVDHKVRSGRFAGFSPRQLPSQFGSEISGVVAELGPSVEGFSVGDEVLGWPAAGSGAFSQYSLVNQDSAVLKPAQLGFVDAAALPVAATTAYDALTHLDLDSGQRLLIVGIGGGVGIATAQLARRRGIRVFGTGSPAKQQLVDSLGAVLIRYGEGESERLAAALPDGVDGIFDLVGGPALAAVAGLVADPAKLVTAADPETAERFGGAMIRRERGPRVLAEVARLAAEGILDPHVTTVLDFADAPAAIAAVESGHALGKVVLRIS